MSYTIGTLIYGVTSDGRDAIAEALGKVLYPPTNHHPFRVSDLCYEDFENNGFHLRYTDDGYPTYWCGIRIGEITEVDNVRVSDLPQPSDEQKTRAREQIANLLPAVQAVCGKPDLWIIWSRS